MVSIVTGRFPKYFKWVGGDVHLYKNHVDQIRLQMGRSPKQFPCVFYGEEPKSIDEFKADQFIIYGYNPHPSIKAEISA